VRRLLLLMSFAAAAAFAQPMHGMGGSERVMEMIRALRIMRMQESLNLTDEQVASLLPRLSRCDSLVLSHRNAQAEDFKALKEELAKRNPSEAKLKEIIGRFKQREAEHHKQMAELRDEMLSVLSVQQQAKFIIFEVEFEREIRGFIERIKEGHGMRGR
jgi:Spy/CpxP family protein refolding chaperone